MRVLMPVSPDRAGQPMSRHTARATTALQRLAEADPALAALALWLAHRDADTGVPEEAREDGDGDPPAWTDGHTVFYGPGFADLHPDEQVGTAAHQILHAALGHPARDRAMAARLGPRHRPRLFNIAADALVNEAVLAAGHSLPRPALTLAPLLARLPGESVPSAAALAKWDVEALARALAGVEGGQSPSEGDGDAPHQAGAETGSNPGPAEDAAARARFAPDIDSREGTARDVPDDTEAAAEWQGRLARALEAGRAAGRGLGALGFRLADLPRSAEPWERHLRRLAARALRPDSRPVWSRPARDWVAMEASARERGAPSPVFRPGTTRARPVPRIALGLDASSSVDDISLGLLLGEVAGIARRSAAELHLMAFDETVRLEARLPLTGTEAALRRLDLPRGGGTDFTDLFARAASLDPALLVVLTDLDAPLPAMPPRRIQVLWATPAAPATQPRYGRVLDLSR